MKFLRKYEYIRRGNLLTIEGPFRLRVLLPRIVVFFFIVTNSECMRSRVSIKCLVEMFAYSETSVRGIVNWIRIKNPTMYRRWRMNYNCTTAERYHKSSNFFSIDWSNWKERKFKKIPPNYSEIVLKKWNLASKSFNSSIAFFFPLRFFIGAEMKI